jgi:hypothetical protein
MMRDLAQAIIDLETQGRLSEDSKESLNMILNPPKKPKQTAKTTTSEQNTGGNK